MRKSTKTIFRISRDQTDSRLCLWTWAGQTGCHTSNFVWSEIMPTDVRLGKIRGYRSCVRLYLFPNNIPTASRRADAAPAISSPVIPVPGRAVRVRPRCLWASWPRPPSCPWTLHTTTRDRYCVSLTSCVRTSRNVGPFPIRRRLTVIVRTF